MKHIKLFEELKEIKTLKEKRPYGSKKIQISKIELDNICSKLDINSDIKFLSSGSFGNAYGFDDKVLKITTDKREAEMAWNLKGVNNPGIVNYYDVYRSKIKGQIYYIIIMDKVAPLVQYVKDNSTDERLEDFCWEISKIIYDNWGNNSREEYLKEVDKFEVETGVKKFIVNKLWNCYRNLKDFKKCDFHSFNLGVIGDRIVMFDVMEVGRVVQKFDIPDLI